MSVVIDKTVVVTTKDGQKIILQAEDQVDVEQVVTLTCDNPKCRQGKDGTPTTFVVDELKAREDPLSIPETFSHSIKVVPDPYIDAALWFCCAKCTKDYLTYSYVPPKTPRERLEEAKHTQAAMQAMQQKKENGCICSGVLKRPDCPVHGMTEGRGIFIDG